MSSQVRGREEQGGACSRGLIKAWGFKEGPQSTRLSDRGLKPASLAVPVPELSESQPS